MGDIAVETEPVEIRVQGVGVDKLENEVPTWDSWTGFPSRAYVEAQQSSTTNKSTRRRETVTRYLVMFEGPVSITERDRIWWPSRAMLLFIDGKPDFCVDPDGTVDHVEVWCVEGVG
jgi:hypothetical protein